MIDNFDGVLSFGMFVMVYFKFVEGEVYLVVLDEVLIVVGIDNWVILVEGNGCFCVMFVCIGCLVGGFIEIVVGLYGGE